MRSAIRPAWVVALLLSCAACATQSAGAARAGASPIATAPDPTVTDGDKYHVLLENEHVRVLRYQDTPGAKTKPHHHAEFVLYALSAFRRRLIFPDGTIKERDFKPGDVIWMPEQVHTGENTGTTDTDVVIVEHKPR
jgi:beta-alanine degradation protein BauB